MRRVPRRGWSQVVVLAGLTVTLAAACSSAADGRGTFAADGASATPGAGGSASPSASPSGTPGRRTLRCSGGKVVSPSGSPYCYTLPAGFTDVSRSVTVDTSVGSEKHRSAVAVADRDLIIVTVYELQLDTDSVSDQRLETELKDVLAQLSRQGFAFDTTTAERSTVDGARAFGYHAREATNKLEANVYFLFRGKTEVEVNCQWKQKAADVQRGCRDVLGSLQVRSAT